MNNYRKKEILRVENISASNKGVSILNHISFSLVEGEILGIVGPLDSGKSTLFHILLKHIRPIQGNILLNGFPIETQKGDFYYISKESSLVPEMTIAENILVTVPVAHRTLFINMKQIKAQARVILDELNIPFDENTKVSQLSPVQRNMIELVKSYTLRRKIVLIDEIFGTYSQNELKNIHELIRSLQKKNMSFIIAANESCFLTPVANRILYFYRGLLIKEVEEHAFFTFSDSEPMSVS